MHLTLDPRRRAKLQALWLVARGSLQQQEIAQITGISSSSLRLLVRQFRLHGLVCLEDRRKNNTRPRKIALEIEAKTPKELQQLLEAQGVRVHLSTAFRFLQRQGIRSVKVLAQPPMPDENSVPVLLN